MMLAALVAAAAAAPVAAPVAQEERAVFYSHPITLRPGQVHNRVDKPIRLPPEVADRYGRSAIEVTGFEVDIVEGQGERERSVPLFDAYNHHYVTFLGPQDALDRLYNHSLAPGGFDPIGGKCEKPRHAHLGMKTARLERAKVVQFGGASGAEFRHNPHDFAEPFAYVVREPTHFASVAHLINTRGLLRAPGEYSPLLECPRTSERRVDLEEGTIDGCLPRPPFTCSEALRAQGNPSCALDTYQGGYRFCEDGVFLTEPGVPGTRDGPESVFRLKFTLRFRGHEPGRVRQLHSALCCDVTRPAHGEGFIGNIEYDIQRCAPGTPPEQCVHVATSVEALDWDESVDAVPGSDRHPDDLVDLAYAVGHVHVGAIRLDLIDELSGQVLCTAIPEYGQSETAGDEAGYLKGIQPCKFGPPPLAPPPRLKRSHPLRTVAYYNSSRAHTGVMSLWLLSIAETDAPAPAA